MLRLSSTSFRCTPQYPMILAGYGDRTEVYQAVGQDLEADFLLLSDDDGRSVVLGSVDTLFLTQKFLSDVTAQLRNTRIPLCLFATHSHNAPSLAPELPCLGAYDHAWYRSVTSTCAKEIDNLIDCQGTRQAVSLRYGERSTALNVNRRRKYWLLDYGSLIREGRLRFGRRIDLGVNRRGVIDRRVRAIFAEAPQGDVQAVIWSFAAHPSRYPEHYHLTPGFPGHVRQALRRRFGSDCTVVYLPGFAGSAIPDIRSRLPRTFMEVALALAPFHPTMRPSGPRAYWEWVDRLVTAILRAYEERENPRGASGVSVAGVNVPGIFLGTHHDDDIDLQIVRVTLAQELEILACNGEMLCEWAPVLEHVVKGTVLLSGYMAGPALYVPTSSQLPEGGYEVDDFKHRFGLEGAFDPDITQMVLSATQRLYSDSRLNSSWLSNNTGECDLPHSVS